MTVKEPAYFDVAIELIAELVAHFDREARTLNKHGDTEAAKIAKKRGSFWFEIRNQLYYDQTIDDDRLDAIIAEAGARLRELDATRDAAYERELHASAS